MKYHTALLICLALLVALGLAMLHDFAVSKKAPADVQVHVG